MANLDMDWDSINKMLDNAKTSSSSGQASIYLKLTPGLHKIRIVPAGNDIDKMPFRKLVQHNWQNVDKTPVFSMCWNYIYNNPTTVAQPLLKEQKLTKDDILLYKKHGCPMCKGLEVLDRAGLSKEAKQPLFPRDSYIWNVLLRPKDNPKSGGDLFVWNTSTKIWQSIIITIKEMKSTGIDILNTESGFDWTIQADGEGLTRRYNVNAFPAPKPLMLDADKRPHNLVEVGNQSFKSYQDTIDTLKGKYGKVFMSIGYEIPGDRVTEIFNKPVTEVSLPQAVENVFTEPEPIVSDGTYFKNGTLYDAETHQPIF